METVQKIPSVVDDIRLRLTAHFGENLMSILLYGSSQRQESFWDLDLMVILKEKKSVLADLSFLRTIVSDYAEHTLDPQLFYANEVASADTFSLDAHGAFFSRVLANATILYGENPFVRFAPTEELVITSLLNRIQRYLFQARQEYLGIGRYVRDKNPQYHQKHLRRVVFDLMLMLEPCQSTKQAEDLFKRYFPNAFSEAEWELFSSSANGVADYMGLYEKVYELALETSRILLPIEDNRLDRGSLNGIVFEYILPLAYTEAIIIVDGLPHTPELRSFMNLLASWGYAVFFPRLKGTWESEGKFLDHNPAEDIQTLAHHLRAGTTLLTGDIKVDRVLVLGVSFGGLVALGASLHDDIAGTIALSPVYAMSAVKGVETLGRFLHGAYGEAYRYAKEDWERFLNDEVLSLRGIAEDSAFNPTKCTVIAGKQDRQIDATELVSLCESIGIVSHLLPAEHLSFHKDISAIRPLLYKLIRKQA